MTIRFYLGLMLLSHMQVTCGCYPGEGKMAEYIA